MWVLPRVNSQFFKSDISVDDVSNDMEICRRKKNELLVVIRSVGHTPVTLPGKEYIKTRSALHTPP